MRKFLSVLAAGVLTITIFSGCTAVNKPVAKEETKQAEKTVIKEVVDTTKPEEPEKPLEKVKLKVAYHPNMGGASAIITGIKKGFFEEQGLDIELLQFTSGPPEIAAMVSGDIDIGYIGHGAHLLAIQGQVKLFALDCLSLADELLASKKSGITSTSDLKGKTIATQLGTSGEVILNLALEKAGLTREDVKVINMDMGGAVSAFVGGKVDAVSIWSPYTTTVKQELGTENVIKLAGNIDFKDDFVFPASWVVTEKYANANREVLIRFTKGLLNAMDYRNANIDETCNYVAELIDIPVDKILANKGEAYWLTSKEVYEGINDGTIESWYKAQQNLFIANDKLESEVPVPNYFDASVIKEAFENLK